MQNNDSVFQDKRKLSLIVIVGVLLIACMAFGGYQLVASAQSKTDSKIEAVELSVMEPVNVQFNGIPAEILCGPYVTATADTGEAVIEKSEMREAVTLDEGTYTVSVVAPAVANDGTIYVAKEPTKVISVEPNVTPDLSFEFTEVDPSDTKAIEKAKNELADVGVTEDVTSAIENKYPNTPVSTENGDQSQQTPPPLVYEGDTSATPVTPSDDRPSTSGNASQGSTQTQTHVHDWVAHTTTTSGGTKYEYSTMFICNDCGGGSRSGNSYATETPHPADESLMIADMNEHFASSGHSGYHLEYRKIAVGALPNGTITTYTCSTCGATK